MFCFSNPNREATSFREALLPQPFLDAQDCVLKYGHAVRSRTGRMKEIVSTAIDLYEEDLDQLDLFFGRPATGNGAYTLDAVRPCEWTAARQDEYCERLLKGIAIAAFGAVDGGQPSAYAKALERLPTILERLEADLTTRQAILVLGEDSCVTSLQFLARAHTDIATDEPTHLHLVANLRSSNLTVGLHRDANFIDTYFLKPVAKKLGLKRSLHLHIASLHLPM